MSSAVPTETAGSRADEDAKPDLDGGGAARGGLQTRMRLAGSHLLGYTTNHLANRLPSHNLRQAWYRRVVGIDVGPGTEIQLGTRFWLYGPGHVRRSGSRIGGDTIINRDCELDTRGTLVIGDHVSLSPEVVILTADHDRDTPGFPLRHRPVVIEDHVWIGMRAMILPGVRIGRGAVVAAGAVVSRDVEALTVVGGVPAHLMGRRLPEALGYRLSGRRPLFE